MRPSIRSSLRALGAGFITIAMFCSWLILISSIWLSLTLFSPDYYKRLITRPGYLPLLREAIEHDLQAQASFATVPDAVLFAGLDNDTIHLQLRQHVVDFAAALGSSSQPGPDKSALAYPAERFYEPLQIYLQTQNLKTGQKTTSEQLMAIQTVADRAAQTVLTHIVLFDPATLMAFDPAWRVLILLQRLARFTLPAAIALAILFLMVAAFSYHDRRQARTSKKQRPSGDSPDRRARSGPGRDDRPDPLLWARTALNSTWIAASLFLVPALILQAQDLSSRLAIQTGYLKFAIKTLVDQANLILITTSGTLFVLAGFGLFALARSADKRMRSRK